MAILIAGPSGVDVLVEPGPGEPVGALADRAAAELELTVGEGWLLTRPDGTGIDPALTVTDAGIDRASRLHLVGASTLAGLRPPVARGRAVAAPAPRPFQTGPDRIEDQLAARPRPTSPPRPARAVRFRPSLTLATATATAGAVIALGVGFGVGRNHPPATDEPAAPPTIVAPVTEPAAVPMLDGASAALGPVVNLSVDNTARPGQILHAPVPRTGTATGWRWQSCPGDPAPCQDIPGATAAIYPAPPTATPITIRVVIDTMVDPGTHIDWVSAPFQALPEPPPTTTTTTTALPPAPAPTDAPAPDPVDPAPAPPA